MNAITLDSCSRTGLVFQDIVSSCEVVNCSSVEVQSTGVMPTIAIDKTDGIVVSFKCHFALLSDQEHVHVLQRIRCSGNRLCEQITAQKSCDHKSVESINKFQLMVSANRQLGCSFD